MIKLHILREFSLSFSLNKGMLYYLKLSDSILSSTNISYKNEQNKQALLIYRKTYNLGALGTYFSIIPTCVRHGVTSKGPHLDSSNNIAKFYDSCYLKIFNRQSCDNSILFGIILHLFTLK